MIIHDPLLRINDLILLSIKIVKNKIEIYNNTAYLRVGVVPLFIQDVLEGLPIEETQKWFSFIEDNIALISVCCEE
jgi:hypothetical protein